MQVGDQRARIVIDGRSVVTPDQSNYDACTMGSQHNRLETMRINTAMPRVLPSNITETNCNGYQVRIVRDGIEHRTSFSFAKHGGRGQALSAAILWRNLKLTELGPACNSTGKYLTRPQKNKGSVQRAGITRYLRLDNRRVGTPSYVTYGVNFVGDDGFARVKTFQAGRVDDISWEKEHHAAQTAETFRSHWEFCRDNNLPFREEFYEGWSDTALYPFSQDIAAKPAL